MFYGATPEIFGYARKLRNNPTKAEKVLWDRLKRKQLGVKFRRQHPIYLYIADFYCHENKLVVEVDGDYHLYKRQKEKDELREEDIKYFGIEIIRFTDEEVLEKTDEVIEKIKRVLALRTPDP